MNALDAELIRAIRRELAKRPVDTTRMDLQVTNGRVIIGGTISNLRDSPNVDLREELAIVEKIFSRNSLVKQLTVSVRFNQAEVEKKEHDGGRGRMRHH